MSPKPQLNVQIPHFQLDLYPDTSTPSSSSDSIQNVALRLLEHSTANNLFTQEVSAGKLSAEVRESLRQWAIEEAQRSSEEAVVKAINIIQDYDPEQGLMELSKLGFGFASIRLY